MTEIAINEAAPFSLLNVKTVREMAQQPGATEGPDAALLQVGMWVRTYLMSAHPDLGRTGDVCPFTAQASRLDTIRLGASDANAAQADEIEAVMRDCFRQFEEIPCPKSMRHFRTVIVGFPNCNSEEGRETLRKVHAKLKYFTLLRARMLGLFHTETDAPGLWNQNFRPLRSPLPILAIRQLVVQDAPFVIRHPMLLPTYLGKFPLGGAKRLLAEVRA